MALTDKLSAIGNAIREKTGTTNLLKLDEMPVAISSIESGGGKYAPRSITFYNYKGTELTQELEQLDTSNITDMYYMFTGCNNLTSLDVSRFNTINVTNMGYMFYNCFKLTSLDLSSFDTSNVTNMYYMFCSCWALTSLDVSRFNTSNVTKMNSMFDSCSKLTSLDLSSFDTSNVTNMSRMFVYCSKLKSLDIRNFTFTKVSNNSSMFDSVPNDCLIIVKSDTEKTWITSNFTTLTNVKTIAEYQAEGGM